VKKLMTILLALIILSNSPVVCESKEPTHYIKVEEINNNPNYMGFDGLNLITPKIVESDKKFVSMKIPLNVEMQLYTQELCDYYNVPYEVVLGVIDVESDFRLDIKSITNDYGLMQINGGNFDWLSETLGVTDLLDPKQNILCGVYILADLMNEYEGHLVFMGYNYGEGGMLRAVGKGYYSSPYSREVVVEIEKWKSVIDAEKGE